jgi:hypothetical protein
MDWGGKTLYEGDTTPEKGHPVLATLDHQKMYPYMTIEYEDDQNRLVILKGEFTPGRNGSQPSMSTPCNILYLPLVGELEKFLEEVIQTQEFKEARE